MPLTLYKRGPIFWFKGRLEELPGSRYYRQSTGKTTEAGARAVLSEFQQRELRRHYSGEKVSITFAEAVLFYDAKPEYAKALLPIVSEIGHLEVAAITPKMVRNLGQMLQPENATDTWMKRIVSPIRAVINNAHELGYCSPIRVKAYSKSERLEQDRKRGKVSRVEKTAGSWEWVEAFCAYAPPHLAAICRFMFETGARISQATQVKFEYLDAQNERIWMPEAKGVEAQWVRLTSELTEELSTLQPRYTKRADQTKQMSDRLFGYLRKDGLYKTWKRVCRDAGIELIMPHAAGRHGFGTEMMVRQGLDPVTVAKAGRWADTQMLLKTYAHSSDAEDQILDAIRTGRVHHKAKNRETAMKDKAKNEFAS